MRVPLRAPWWLPAAMLAPLWAGPVWAGPIITQVTPPMRCPAGKVLVRADFKTCPTEHRRRARTTRRACCQGESGKVHLHALSPLPEPLSRVTSEM